MPRRYRNILVLILLLAGASLGYPWLGNWLKRHPEHNPWAPMTLDQSDGWATPAKLARLRSDPRICRADMAASGVTIIDLAATGDGHCRRTDRSQLNPAGVRLSPSAPDATCAVNFGLERWLRRDVQPAARCILGSEVVGIEHFGTYSCRKMRGRESWSEHATANAIDITAFRLADGRRISIRTAWNGQGNEQRFVRTVRDRACTNFGTVLSPDYNAAHADHLHLDQAMWTICR